MNPQLNFLYRDAGNYKQFHHVVFENKQLYSVDDLNQRIRSKLIDGSWFIASKWNLPDLRGRFTGFDSELDHDWHEFESITETTEVAASDLDISEFIERVEKLG